MEIPQALQNVLSLVDTETQQFLLREYLISTQTEKSEILTLFSPSNIEVMMQLAKRIR